jgi:hypothetical protein
MKKLFFLPLLFICCKAGVVVPESTTTMATASTVVQEDSETTAETISKGNAPVVLYRNDIRLLGIKQIEINEFSTQKNQKSNQVLQLQTNFDSIGLLQSFSVVHQNEQRKKAIVTGTFKTSHTPTIEGYPAQYFYNLYNRRKKEFEKITLQIIINPNTKKDTNLLNLQVLPFLGDKGYIFSKQNVFQGNTITYTTIETDEGYDVAKQLLSNATYKETYSFSDPDLSSPIQKSVDATTGEVRYFYYGDNPLQVYEKQSLKEYDTEENEAVTYEKIYYKDSIYNTNRWLGFTAEDFSPYANQPKEAYYGVLDEKEIVTNTFSKQQVTYCTKDNFFINGQNGYDYLRDAYTKKIATEALENEHATKHESVQKNEIQELPKKIVVQVSLTDFWCIQLTE